MNELESERLNRTPDVLRSQTGEKKKDGISDQLLRVPNPISRMRRKRGKPPLPNITGLGVYLRSGYSNHTRRREVVFV